MMRDLSYRSHGWRGLCGSAPKSKFTLCKHSGGVLEKTGKRCCE
ncbi:hypothetical protein AmDm5_1771 [Acetobacter malorum]|nr:hypothetical protein AmDm5_1771 [Acetobacter malorum]